MLNPLNRHRVRGAEVHKVRDIHARSASPPDGRETVGRQGPPKGQLEQVRASAILNHKSAV